MRITATTVALLIHHAARADKASKGPAKGGKGKKGKSGKGTTGAPTGALCTSANSFNNTSLREAVTDYFDQACLTNITCGIIRQYGVIGGWRVCEVTEMESLFSFTVNSGAELFNEPLNDWDVSKVTVMRAMFYGAAAYNQPLNDWDVSKVTDMLGMFYEATAYNQPMNGWDVSKVTDMAYMFGGAAKFNQPLNDWNINCVTRIEEMFSFAAAYNQPLCTWGTKLQKTATVDSMFSYSGCVDKGAPNLTLVPPGPFCEVCPGLF
jgi:hypothetical protein